MPGGANTWSAIGQTRRFGSPSPDRIRPPIAWAWLLLDVAGDVRGRGLPGRHGDRVGVHAVDGPGLVLRAPAGEGVGARRETHGVVTGPVHGSCVGLISGVGEDR